ncbi:LytTR family transcriptional regulator DNA-binding domain-containing protein [Rapidithrix thailandica]|uniref:LytTR family transcriptional regulator DNA-binding domain-containing protein n=1 Tax=Rapidithrix thailandica TaxID=413964 RepID=A0AAW9S8N1_9BACT
MSKVKVLIVEDDFIHANRLEMYLDEMGYDLAGIAQEAEQALDMIATAQPDLLLVDIHLAGSLDGVQMMERLNKKKALPAIFITSYRDKETFERAKLTDPYAYIIKPYDKETLQAAIELAIYKFSKSQHDQEPFQGWQEDHFLKGVLFVKSKRRLIKIKISDILCVEAKDKVCQINVEEEIIETRMPLQKLEEKLTNNAFLRVHRSFIINKEKISQIDLSKNEILLGACKVPIGRLYKEAFINCIAPFLD